MGLHSRRNPILFALVLIVLAGSLAACNSGLPDRAPTPAFKELILTIARWFMKLNKNGKTKSMKSLSTPSARLMMKIVSKAP